MLTLSELLSQQPIHWHGVKLNTPDWSHESHSLAVTAQVGDDRLVHIMVNAYWNALEFEVPAAPAEYGSWRRTVDTFLDSPDDIHDPADAPVVSGSTYVVQPRSMALLIASASAPAAETR